MSQKIVKIGLLLAGLCLAVIVWYVIVNHVNLFKAAITTDTPIAPIESIFFSAVPIDNNESGLSYAGTLALETKSFDIYTDFPGYSPAGNNADYYSGLSIGSEALDKAVLQPTLIDKKTLAVSVLETVEDATDVSDLVVADDLQLYAYSYSGPASSFAEDPKSLHNKNLAIHNRNSDDIIVIYNAIRPSFLSSSQEVVYMKSGGIYRLDMQNFTEALILPSPQVISEADNYAISADGRLLILTIPSRNLLSLYHRQDNGEYSQTKIIEAASETAYFYPVINPDGSKYAVVKVDTTNPEDQHNPNMRAQIELRTTTDNVVEDTISVADTIVPTSIQLSWWGYLYPSSTEQ